MSKTLSNSLRPPSGIQGKVDRAASDYLTEIYWAITSLLSRTSNLEVQARTALAVPAAPDITMTTGINTGDQQLTVTPIRKVTANTTITLADEMLLADATSGNLTVTLPRIASVPIGQAFSIKRLDFSPAAYLHITGDANIDGAATRSLSSQYESITVQSDGTQWWIK